MVDKNFSLLTNLGMSHIQYSRHMHSSSRDTCTNPTARLFRDMQARLLSTGACFPCQSPISQLLTRHTRSSHLKRAVQVARDVRVATSRRRVAMVTASSSQQQKKQQPWGTRLAAVVVGLSLLVTLPWESLDHEFPYDTTEVPDTGPQDKPRCVPLSTAPTQVTAAAWWATHMSHAC